MSLQDPSAPIAITPGNEYNAPVQPFPAPESTYIGEQDTNRLARGGDIVARTSIQIQDSTRATGIPIAMSLQTWDQPLSGYASLYPYNHVRATTNGLVEEFDDTPNSVRYRRFHPSGTFVETDNEGSTVRRTVGQNYEIIEQDNNVYIKGNCNLTVEGQVNILVKTNCNIQVEGNMTATVRNDLTAAVSGSIIANARENFAVKCDRFLVECNKVDISAAEQYTLRAGKQDETVVGKTTKKTAGFDIESTDKTVIKTAGLDVESTDKTIIKTVGLEIGSSARTVLQTPGFDILSSSGPIRITTTIFDVNASQSSTIRSPIGSFGVGVSGNLVLDAPTIYLNTTSISGSASIIQQESIGNNFFVAGTIGSVATPSPQAPGSAPSTPSAPASPRETQNLGLVSPLPRATPTPPNLPAIRRFDRVDRLAHTYDEAPRGTSELWPNYNESRPQPNTAPTTPTPPTADVIRPENEQEILSRTSFPDSLIISNYYTLGKVSTFCPASHESVIPQMNLTSGQIVLNLSLVARNVLDKIADRYGVDDVIVTSGFRVNRPDRQQGQHGIGQAIDLQFRGIPASGYYDRALEIAQLVPFDTFLLEYKNTGTRMPWLHISFNANGNRGIARTFFNHQQVAQGFVNLQQQIERRETAQVILQRLSGRTPTELETFRQSASIV